MSLIEPRIGMERAVYAWKDDGGTYRMAITKRGTTNLELNWTQITDEVYNELISLEEPEAVDTFASDQIERRRHETAMVA